jgi:hypothetical protein
MPGFRSRGWVCRRRVGEFPISQCGFRLGTKEEGVNL